MKHNDLVVTIGKLKPKGFGPKEKEEDSESESSESSDSGLDAAFGALAEALGLDSDNLDSAAGVKALKAFFAQCGDEGEEKEESDSGF